MTATPTIRIYMACLAAYNYGILHGRWIDATQGTEHIQQEIKAMLKGSPMPNVEEHALHDYEGFEGISLSEWEGINSIVEVAEFIEEHGKLGAALMSYYNDISDAQNAISEHYAGHYDSVADFAEEMTEQTCTIPETLRYYIDYEAMGRDMAINDILTLKTTQPGVHLFWHH